MPELPEVETVRLQLLHALKYKHVQNIKALHPKYTDDVKALRKKLIGKELGNIDRIGKLLIFSFTNESNLFMLGHLKMTGQFIAEKPNHELTGGGHTLSEADYLELPSRHSRIEFDFTDGTRMFFNDMRMFGYVRLADANTVTLAKSRFGPEPSTAPFPYRTFTSKVRRSHRPIKAILLDQSIIAGLGNIYVDEVLFDTKISPFRLGVDITDSEAKAIVQSARKILNRAIKAGGTTFQHFLDVENNKGNYTNQLKVFGHQGESCPGSCGGTIVKVRLAGRGTHYCPQCQK